MTPSKLEGLWHALQDGNPWWPTYHPRRTDVLSWRHAAAILLREVDPEPIFAALPALFEAIYDQTADAICERLSGTEDRLTWAIWHDVWLEHFDSWNDPIRQLVEQHCVGPDAMLLGEMFTRVDGASFCDFVLDAYDRVLINRAAFQAALNEEPPLILNLIGTGWPFERLAYGFYQRCCSELDQEPETAPQPMSALDLNRAGHPNVYRENAA
ncbi:hypothetical protein WAB17_07760 [Parerythrobacter aurantius]|uniref:hypothetical protein n=1 Tax=Parerythrobacter aurantius TaxID=3127706 RepID=UPI003248EE58